MLINRRRVPLLAMGSFDDGEKVPVSHGRFFHCRDSSQYLQLPHCRNILASKSRIKLYITVPLNRSSFTTECSIG